MGFLRRIKKLLPNHSATLGNQLALESLEPRLLLATEYHVIGLGTLGGDRSWAEDINNDGQIIGYSEYNPGSHLKKPFLWENGSMSPINIPVSGSARAYGMNNLGHVVGQDGEGCFKMLSL